MIAVAVHNPSSGSCQVELGSHGALTLWYAARVGFVPRLFESCEIATCVLRVENRVGGLSKSSAACWLDPCSLKKVAAPKMEFHLVSRSPLPTTDH